MEASSVDLFKHQLDQFYIKIIIIIIITITITNVGIIVTLSQRCCRGTVQNLCNKSAVNAVIIIIIIIIII